MKSLIIFIRSFSIGLCTIYSLLKIKKHNKINNFQKFIFLIVLVVTSLFFAILKIYEPSQVLTSIFAYSILIMLNSYILNLSKTYSIVLTVFSLSFSYIAYLCSCILIYPLCFPIIDFLVEKNIDFIIAGILQFILVFLFFKIRRFKDGFPFLKEESRKIGIIGALICVITITASVVFSIYDARYSYYLLFCLIIGGLIMFNWIRRKIKENYKEDLKEQLIQQQLSDLQEKDKIIANLTQELSNILKEKHEFNHSFLSIGHKLNELSSLLENNKENFNTEFAEELSLLTNSYENISEIYKSKMMKNKKDSKKLPTTNIYELDILLNYMCSEAEENFIDFNLKINDSITYMTQNLIPLDSLKTLLSNHIENSIISIKHSENKYKAILVMLGLIDNNYEIAIYDSGIEFEINTLINLGLIPATTHKNTGGTGTGFVLIFEILKQTNSSIIIEERTPDSNNYTKSVTIRFDNKNEYIIKSYRANELEKYNTDNRIILENL